MSTTCKKQFHKKLYHMDVTKNHFQHQIKNGEYYRILVRSILGIF